MKSLCTKITAIIAMVISVLVLLSFGLMLVLVSMENSVIHQGIGLAWMTLDFMGIILALFLYAIDAVLSFIKSCMKIDPVFNMVLSLIIFAEICTQFIFIAVLDEILIIPWCLLYLAIFVLEIISIKRHIKMKSSTDGNSCRGLPRLPNF